MTPSTQQLTIDRLNREQVNLVRVLYNMIGDVQYLLQLVDHNDMSVNDCEEIAQHFKEATEIALSLVDGE